MKAYPAKRYQYANGIIFGGLNVSIKVFHIFSNLIIEIYSDVHEIQINRLLVYFQGCTKDLHHEIKSLDRSLIMLVGSIYFSYILRERVGTRTMCNKTTSVEYILLLGCFCSNEANKNV